MGVVNLKIIKSIVFWILSIIGILILILGTMILISAIQAKIFLPKEYIIWIFKYPAYRLAFIYELYIIFGFIYVFNKDMRWIINLKKDFIKRHKVSIFSTFVILNIVLIYTILFNVTVITNNKIINYTFLSPQGKQYSYNDIVKIDTGVYGKKKLNLPFALFKGRFLLYYTIK